MIAVEMRGAVMLGSTEMGSKRLTTKTTMTELVAVRAEAKATPLYPKTPISRGVKPQVNAVHKIISCKLVLIFPIAFKVLVSVVDKDAQRAFTPKRVKEMSAGCHFS